MRRALPILAALAIITMIMMACSSQGNKAKEAKSYNDQGVSLAKNGQFDQAIAKFNQAIQLDPQICHSL